MRTAIQTRNSHYNGRFFYGVITTGVFCRPSCSSRRALPQNLRFFSNSQAALAAGFRPCKRCHPINKDPHLAPLIDAARHIETFASENLTLSVLAKQVGLSTSQLQRSFKKSFGISPKVYQDAVRMRLFKKSLKDGDAITDAIYSSGFGSVSRIYGESTRTIGMTPTVYRAGGVGEVITYVCRNTSLGLMALAATAKGICFLQFSDTEKTLVKQLHTEFPKAELVASTAQKSAELDLWIETINHYINSGGNRPDLPLDLYGTAFQMKVWRFLLSVNDGDVLSYSELADGIARPKAVRAVASACAANRVAVLIPCHRVLRADGNLGGYKWGLERKRALLDAERSQR